MNDTTTPTEPTATETLREHIRVMVRGTYDFQKLRIQTGNRIAANFRSRIGLEPSQKEEEDADAANILKAIRFDYKLIADGIAAKTKSGAVTPRNFKPEGVISTFTEFSLIHQYLEKEQLEKRHFAQLEKVLRDHPIYTGYLQGVKGVGAAMAGVMISEIDINKAHTPSALWKYAGLDTVNYWERMEGDERYFPEQLEYIERRNKETLAFEHQFEAGTPVEWEHVLLDQDGKREHVCEVKLEASEGGQHIALYKNICLGGRSRKAEHLVDVTYIDSEGEEKTRKSITFNPWLKTKLVGVLGSSFLRAGVEDNPYRAFYDTYKDRITQQNDLLPEDERRSKGHIHNMAVRYMVKAFLQNLYLVWRAQENLPITSPYVEGKIRAGKQFHRAA